MQINLPVRCAGEPMATTRPILAAMVPKSGYTAPLSGR